MKEVIVDKFDGIVMSAVVGNRIELDESKAIAIVNEIAARETTAAEKAARIESLRAEADTLQSEAAIEAPTLEADTAEAKALIKQFIDCYEQRGIVAPKTLVVFVGGQINDAPPAVAEPVTV